ncbi:MAG: circadian clock protein KaiC [Actinomycetota bacterium]|nr:circadian clock protein KaiC [Actinomycetota bacterium]
MRDKSGGVTKIPTGIDGFDLIALGGLPANRMTLVAGTTGSGKTLFGLEFLMKGILQFDEPGVFVTFEESPSDLRKVMTAFDYDIDGKEESGEWTFIDATLTSSPQDVVVGDYDLGALIARIGAAVQSIGAKRVVLDSTGSLFSRFADTGHVRFELFRLAAALREQGTTSVLTMEIAGERNAFSRFGVEEFVADNVVVLRNILEEAKRRRTIEILKFRGAPHRTGEWLFTIVASEGFIVIPVSLLGSKELASSTRVSTGNTEVDRMCGGGFYRDSAIIVSGPTGVGKTLMAIQFIAAGVAQGECCVLFSFEESRDQLIRNAASWGFDLPMMERSGNLRIACEYPEMASLEDHFVSMKQVIEEYQPVRLAVDNLSALERVATARGLRDFIIGMTSFVKHQEITSLFTSTTRTLMGASSITEAHISAITDTIVVMRYAELAGEIRRAITLLKMRGSSHDTRVREFSIDGEGIHVGMAFGQSIGILGLAGGGESVI